MSTTRHSDSKEATKEATKDAPAEAPKAKAAATPAKAPERSYRDPQCAEMGRHRPNCDCVGDARKPIE